MPSAVVGAAGLRGSASRSSPAAAIADSRCVRPPRSARAAPRWRHTARGCDRWLAARRPARPANRPRLLYRIAATPCAKLTACPWPAGGALGDGGPDQPGGLGFPAGQAGEPQRGERRVAGSGRLGDHLGLRDQGGGGREVTAADVGRGLRGQVDRQLIEGADGPGELGLPHGNRVPAVLVPQHDGGRLGQPAPPQVVFREDLSLGEGTRGLAQRWRRGGRAVGDQPGQAVEQQVGQPCRLGWLAAPGQRGKPRPDRRRPPAARRTSRLVHAFR